MNKYDGMSVGEIITELNSVLRKYEVKNQELLKEVQSKISLVDEYENMDNAFSIFPLLYSGGVETHCYSWNNRRAVSERIDNAVLDITHNKILVLRMSERSRIIQGECVIFIDIAIEEALNWGYLYRKVGDIYKNKKDIKQIRNKITRLKSALCIIDYKFID